MNTLTRAIALASVLVCALAAQVPAPGGGGGGGTGTVTSVTAGASGAVSVDNTNPAAPKVDIDTSVVPRKAIAESVSGIWDFTNGIKIAGASPLTPITVTFNTTGATCSGSGTSTCTASNTAGSGSNPGIVITHSLSTSTPWVTCYDGSGNILGGSTATVGVSNVVANSSSQATVTLTGALTSGTCVVSTGSMGPQGATGATGATGANGAIATIADEGTGLTQRGTLNFIGTGITCADNSGSARTDCTISSGFTPYAVQLTRTAAFSSFSGSTQTAVPWDTVVFDTSGSSMWNVSNPTRLVAPVTGYYRFTCGGQTVGSATASNIMFVTLWKTSTSGTQLPAIAATGGGNYTAAIANQIVYLAANEYVVCAYNPGAALTPLSGAGTGAFAELAKLW